VLPLLFLSCVVLGSPAHGRPSLANTALVIRWAPEDPVHIESGSRQMASSKKELFGINETFVFFASPTAFAAIETLGSNCKTVRAKKELSGIDETFVFASRAPAALVAIEPLLCWSGCDMATDLRTKMVCFSVLNSSATARGGDTSFRSIEDSAEQTPLFSLTTSTSSSCKSHLDVQMPGCQVRFSGC
jgi:hypothetical protein